MHTVTRLFAAIALTLFACLPQAGAAEETTTAPPAAGYYVLTGDWKGAGSVRENGQQSQFDLHMQCQKASQGWAVLCTMNGHDRAGKQVLAETDLFGVDPLTGTGHWYAVTNTGDTHDHVVHWKGPHTLQARYTWRQEGKPMEERIVLHLSAANSLEFRSVTSENGHEVSVFSGTLQRGS